MSESKNRQASLHRLLPISNWLKDYGRSDFDGDLVAGLTVGVMLIPQSMAYALLAGVPPIYGLYASLIPLVVYPIFGTSKQLAGGVIAIDMLIVAAGLSALAEPFSDHYIELAIVLALMVGVIQIVMGASGLGFIVNLLSRPIITGFASGAALIIAFSQLGSLMGLTVASTSRLHELLPAVFAQLENVHRLTFGVGLGALAILLLVREWARRVPGPLLVAVLSTLAAWFFSLDAQGLSIVGDIRSGLPGFSIPVLQVDELGDLGITAITLALVQFMTVVTLGKVFAAKHRYSIQPNSELIAMGAANVAGSFFRSIPVSGSFSRSVVNDQSGAKTPMANIIAAVLVGLTLLFFMPLIRFLPITVLSAIIIVAAFGLFDVGTMIKLWRVKRVDGAICVVTFLVTLFVGIQHGIVVGILLSVVAVMYRISVPNVAELGLLPGTQTFRDISRNPEAQVFPGLLVVRIEASFSFVNAEFLKSVLDTRSRDEDSISDIVIDADSINDLDTTAAAALVTAADFLDARGVRLHFGGVKSSVADMMTKSGLIARIGPDRLHLNTYTAAKSIRRERGDLI